MSGLVSRSVAGAVGKRNKDYRDADEAGLVGGPCLKALGFDLIVTAVGCDFILLKQNLIKDRLGIQLQVVDILFPDHLNVDI